MKDLNENNKPIRCWYVLYKKVLLIVIVLATVAFSSTAVLSADVLTRMLFADEIESFRKDQDALIIGELIDKNDNLFLVKVIKVMSGKVDAEEIWVEEFDYAWLNADNTVKPSVTDFAVLSIKRYDNLYKKAWGAFKASSGDYRTLKLLTEDISYPAGNTDIAALQWYINSGGLEKEFYFIGSQAYVRRPNGEELQIYPPGETTELTWEGSSYVPEEEREANGGETNTVYKGLIRNSPILILLALALLGIKRKNI